MECSICLEPLITDNNDTDSNDSVFTLKSCLTNIIMVVFISGLQTNATCPICRDYVYQVLPCKYITNRLFHHSVINQGFSDLEWIIIQLILRAMELISHQYHFSKYLALNY